jgi:hypothetical protein
MHCPRCGSDTGVRKSYKPEAVRHAMPAKTLGRDIDTYMQRARKCKNPACSKTYITYEMSVASLQALLADVSQQAVAELLEATK